MKMKARALLWAAIGLAGCSHKSAESCIPGKVEACACASGATGTQTCAGDGTFGACSCGTCVPQALVPCFCDAAEGLAMCSDDGTPGVCDCTRDAGSSDRAKDGAADAPTDASKPPPALITLDMPAKHLTRNPVTGVLYATIASTAAKDGNSVVTLDGETGTVMATTAVGAEPNAIAVSEDGTTVWVGVDGVSSIQKLDVTASPAVASAPAPLPPFEDNPTSVYSMFVLAGSTVTVVASLNHGPGSPSHAGVHVFDDGVPRAKNTGTRGDVFTVFPAPAGRAYGLGTSSFYVITIGPTGASGKYIGDLVAGGSQADPHHSSDDHRIYTGLGDVLDVTDPAKPAYVARFSFVGPIWPRASLGELWMVNQTGKSPDTITARRLDTTTFASKASRPYAVPSANYVWDVVPAGSSRVAFLTRADWEGPARIQFALLP